jgi:regulator of protease activity HflC (stomatin/prohibitin superfamily)
MTEILIYAGVAVIVSVGLMRMIKVASEYQRFAEFSAGRYMGLKGPGLLLKFTGSDVAWVPIRVGDRGELVGNGVARFQGRDLPVTAQSPVPLRRLVMVTEFRGQGREATIVVDSDPDQRRTITCEKCGHVMEVG